MIRSFFFGVLGFGIFLVPVTLFYLCVMTEKEKQVARYKLKLFLCVVIILFIGALIYAGSGAKYSDMNFFACLGNLFKDASDTSKYMTFDCGIIGGLLGYPLVVLFGSTAALFTSFVVTAALILIVANISIKDMTAAASRTAVHIREAGEERARVRRERREENRERKLAERGDIDIALEGKNRKSSGSFIDIPLDDKKTKVKKAKSAVNGIDTDIADWAKVPTTRFLQLQRISQTKSQLLRLNRQRSSLMPKLRTSSKKHFSKAKKTTARRPAMKLRNSLTELFVPIILKKKKRSISFHRFSCSNQS